MKPRNNIKTHILLMAAVAAVAAVSCTKSEPTLVEQPQPRTIQIRAALPQPATTRTLFEGATWNNTDGYGFSKIKWKPGDKISILCWQEGESWGKRISKKSSSGSIVEDNGEIIHSLQASEISSDGTKMNFSFVLPSDIDNTKDIYVMLTYLGKSEYIPPSTDYLSGKYKNKPWLSFNFPAISEADDREDFAYIANAVPMILKYTIPKGHGSGDTQPLIDGTFKHICTLFAVDIKNGTSASITPEHILIEYKNGNAIDSGSPYYDPVDDRIESNSTNKKTEVRIYNYKDIKPGERFVYFLSTIIDKTAPLNDLTVVYKDKNASSYILTKTSKTSTKTLERGKCYTLNVKVTDISSYWEGLEWETTIPGSAAPME